jgi:hypothetical protein
MNKNVFLMAAVAGCLLFAQSQAVFAGDRPAPPLKPGQSAGVHVAQQTHTGLALVGAGAIIAVVIVAATAGNGGNGNNNNPPSVTTTTTP